MRLQYCSELTLQDAFLMLVLDPSGYLLETIHSANSILAHKTIPVWQGIHASYKNNQSNVSHCCLCNATYSIQACHYQCVHPPQFPPSGNFSRRIFLTWPFPHRHQHARWPVDIVELLHRFCCWALIWMSCHWAWLCWGYRRNRNLVDWLIVVLITPTCWWYPPLFYQPESQ